MKLKPILFTCVAALFATAAQANNQNITSPFYAPGQGEFLSNTTLASSRGKLDKKYGGDTLKSLVLGERLTYGLNDKFVATGYMGNYFGGSKYSSANFNNDHNFEYGLGIGYTNQDEAGTFFQGSLGYYTYQPSSWWTGADNKWDKSILAQAKIGYEAENGFIPYLDLRGEFEIDDGDRTQGYVVRAALYKLWEDFSADLGASYNFSYDGKDCGYWLIDASLDYLIADNMTVGLFGDYYIDGKQFDRMDYKRDYTTGVSFKYGF